MERADMVCAFTRITVGGCAYQGVNPVYGPDVWERLWFRLNELEEQIRKLKKENRELKEKLENLRPVRIDKVEYKIHELNIETLSGTLNVGLTASGEDPEVGEWVEKLMEKGGSNIVVESGKPDGNAGPDPA